MAIKRICTICEREVGESEETHVCPIQQEADSTEFDRVNYESPKPWTRTTKIVTWTLVAAALVGVAVGLSISISESAALQSSNQASLDAIKAKKAVKGQEKLLEKAQSALSDASAALAASESTPNVDQERNLVARWMANLQTSIEASNYKSITTDMNTLNECIESLMQLVSPVAVEADPASPDSPPVSKTETQRWAGTLGSDIISNRCQGRPGTGSYFYYWRFGRWVGQDMIWSITEQQNGDGLVQAIRFTALGGGTWEVGPTDESPIQDDPFNSIGESPLICETFTASQ
jgi:hypothetical protein